MKKSVCLTLLSFLLACFCLSWTSLPVLAAPAHTTIASRQTTHTTPVSRRKGRVWHPGYPRWGGLPPYDPGFEEINQYHIGDTNFNNPANPVGHGQGNSGNHGHNRGRNQDNSSNGGNQMVLLNHSRGNRRVNQYSYGRSNYNNPRHSHGYDQGNSGNDGRNDGLNQDNSSNGGNQILN